MNILGNPKNQFILGSLIIIVLIIFYYIIPFNIYISLIFGTFFGFTLQRSRFCFVAAFRDPLLFGNTKLANALILSLAIMTIIFPVIQKIRLEEIGVLVGNVHPVGVHTVVGALLFGFGMVIAGGCASGTLMRVGEGYLLQIVVLFGFIIGTLLGAGNFDWWHRNFISKSPTFFLPNTLGWVGAVIFQLFFLFLVYMLIRYISNRKKML